MGYIWWDTRDDRAVNGSAGLGSGAVGYWKGGRMARAMFDKVPANVLLLLHDPRQIHSIEA